MALPDGRLAEISAVAMSTGDDPALDALIIRLHSETACRRGGALALTPEDLDPQHCLIRLHEKGGTERWQPVSPTLMAHLLAHAESRGGLDSAERLLRYATSKPITARRYDYLWNRLGEHLPWVKTQQVSTHWIRHTTLTWVERRFGFAVAQAYAGHQDAARGARAMSATGTYVRAGLPEVATVLAVLTGEPHCPLTTKIARPAALTCHEESLLSICGYRDVRLARFWQRLDSALVNEDCSSGALAVREMLSAELDDGCALGWQVTGSDIAHGQGEDPLLAVVSLPGSEPWGPWGVEVPSGFFGEREVVAVVRRLDQEADPVWGGL
jgi:hypothetical protein